MYIQRNITKYKTGNDNKVSFPKHGQYEGVSWYAAARGGSHSRSSAL